MNGKPGFRLEIVELELCGAFGEEEGEHPLAHRLADVPHPEPQQDPRQRQLGNVRFMVKTCHFIHPAID